MDIDAVLSPLNPDEREVVRSCLAASVQGPFFCWFLFPDDDPGVRPDPDKHHPARCATVSRARYDRSGPDDWNEFQTIFGVYPDEVRQILDAWPDFERLPTSFLDEGLVKCAINNAMNNLLGYPHGCDDVWDRYVPASRQQVGQVFEKWKAPRRSQEEPSTC